MASLLAREQAYAATRSFDRGTLVDRFNIDDSQTEGAQEIDVNRALLRLFGIKFFGTRGLLGGAWNSSKREGYTLDEISSILTINAVDVRAEDFVRDTFGYRVINGWDFAYKFYERDTSTGKKYFLGEYTVDWGE